MGVSSPWVIKSAGSAPRWTHHCILPKRNEHDLDELPEDVRQTLTFVPVEMIHEVLSTALQPVAEYTTHARSQK